MQRRVWENVSQLKVTYRNGPLGRQAQKGVLRPGSGARRPRTGHRARTCRRRRQTTLHAELGNKRALVIPGRMVSDEYAAVVAKGLGGDGMITSVADHGSNEEIMLVRPTRISAGEVRIPTLSTGG